MSFSIVEAFGHLNLGRAVVESFVLRVFNLLLVLGCSVILARSLGPAEFGVYAYMFAVVTLLALPAQVGLPTLIVRETAKAYGRDDWSTLQRLWGWGGTLVLVSSSVILVVGLIFAWFLRDAVEQKYLSTYIVGLFLVPMLALSSLRGAALRGLRLIGRGQLPESIIRPLLLALLVIGLPLMGLGFTAVNAMLMHLVAATCAFAVGAVFLWRAGARRMAVTLSELKDTKAWLASIMPLAFVAAMQTLSNQTDIVMLGILMEDANVGIYKVVVSGTGLILFGLQIANMVISPRLASHYAQNELVRLQQVVTFGVALSAAIAIPITFVLIVWGDRILGFVYGMEYVAGYSTLVILAVSQALNAMFGSVGMLLNMSGHERYSALWLGVSTLANISLNLILIPEFGMVGAAFATLISVCIWNVAFWRLAMRKIGIDASFLSVFKQLV